MYSASQRRVSSDQLLWFLGCFSSLQHVQCISETGLTRPARMLQRQLAVSPSTLTTGRPHPSLIRSSGLAKTVLQRTIQGGRRKGRQRKRWEDNVKEWTGLEWNITLRKAESREEWRMLVVKSTMVPQRSARLRDRWDELS